MSKKKPSASGKQPKKSQQKAPKPAQDWLNSTPITTSRYPEDGSPWIAPRTKLPGTKKPRHG